MEKEENMSLQSCSEMERVGEMFYLLLQHS